MLAWQIFYYNFMPDFFEKYSAHVIEQARASGATPEAIQAQTKQLEQDIALYKQPIFHILFVFLEPFPVGLLITFVSSLILRKRKPAHPAPTAAV